MRKDYMQLGYVILSSYFLEDAEIREKFFKYEAWLYTQENSAQVYQNQA